MKAEAAERGVKRSTLSPLWEAQPDAAASTAAATRRPRRTARATKTHPRRSPCEQLDGLVLQGSR